MTVADYVWIGQSCAITVVFLWIAYHTPSMWSRYLTWKKEEFEATLAEAERVRAHDAARSAADRAARHELAAVFQKTLADAWAEHRRDNSQLVEAMTDLRVAVDALVRGGDPGRKPR